MNVTAFSCGRGYFRKRTSCGRGSFFKRIKKDAFSKISGYVWTGPESPKMNKPPPRGPNRACAVCFLPSHSTKEFWDNVLHTMFHLQLLFLSSF